MGVRYTILESSVVRVWQISNCYDYTFIYFFLEFFYSSKSFLKFFVIHDFTQNLCFLQFYGAFFTLVLEFDHLISFTTKRKKKYFAHFFHIIIFD